MKNNKIRLLGAQEILFYALNEGSPKHFLMAADINGRLDPVRWKAALKLLQSRHPMLSVRITQNGDQLFFEHIDSEIQFELLQVNPTFSINSALERELENGFPSAVGPLIRLKVFEGAGQSTLVVAAHHSISDAMSVVYLINDLLKIEAGLEPDKLPVKQSVDEYLGMENDRIAHKMLDQFKPGVHPTHDFLKDKPPVKIALKTLDTAQTTQLVRQSKKEHTTVHGFLLAAAALAFGRLVQEINDKIQVMSPFSVREVFGIEQDFGLFIDTKVTDVEIMDIDHFWDMARQAKNGLSDVTSEAFLKNSATQLRGLVSNSDDLLQFVNDHFKFQLMLSNLGQIKLSDVKTVPQLTNIYGPMIITGLGNQQAIGVTTFDGRLNLAYASRYPIIGLLNEIAGVITEVLHRSQNN